MGGCIVASTKGIKSTSGLGGGAMDAAPVVGSWGLVLGIDFGGVGSICNTSVRSAVASPGYVELEAAGMLHAAGVVLEKPGGLVVTAGNCLTNLLGSPLGANFGTTSWHTGYRPAKSSLWQETKFEEECYAEHSACQRLAWIDPFYIAVWCSCQT